MATIDVMLRLILGLFLEYISPVMVVGVILMDITGLLGE
jgi:hypothetical protein